LGVFKIMAAAFERRPLSSVGLALHSCWGRELGFGLCVGAAMILGVAALEWISGLARFSANSLSPPSAFSSAGFNLLLLAMVAANEELVFRGYPFQRLVEAITRPGAVAVSATLFGLGHLANAHHTWISTANTALVGVPLAIAYLRTRALWMPIGIHFIWNFILGILLGLPVSGVTFADPLLKAQVHGASWLSGADYGPEGGLLATVVIVGATVYLLLSKRIYVSEEMKELVFGVSPSSRPLTIAGTPGSALVETPPGSGKG
jgi:membrane protease YdiL (CAAX protease family)